MKKLSEKISSIAPSATIEIADKARKMKAQGLDVISLSIGEPDFDTPAHITKACIEALECGKTHYEASQGLLELREAVSDKLKSENNIPAKATDIIIACGAKNSISEAMEACLNPGDEVIILDPSWVSYEPAVQMAGGISVHHSLNRDNFQADDTILEKISKNTKMIVFNSPSNPTGSVLNSDSLTLLKDVCEDNDIIALSDEIYEKLIYEKKHVSIASIGDMHERTITINGFSKAYSMTGWRVGYICAPETICSAVLKIHQYVMLSAPTTAQYAAVEALRNGADACREMVSEYKIRRNLFVNGLNRAGLKTHMPNGAFYAFPNITEYGISDEEFAERLLKEHHVAVVPGSVFGPAGVGHLRCSYAVSREDLMTAVGRIEQFVSDL